MTSVLWTQVRDLNFASGRTLVAQRPPDAGFQPAGNLMAKDKPQHQPERTCIACGAKRSQSDFLRVAAHGASTPVVDTPVVEIGKANGRGAYLCFDANCLERALKRKAFERALKLKSTLAPELRAALETLIKDGNKSGE